MILNVTLLKQQRNQSENSGLLQFGTHPVHRGKLVVGDSGSQLMKHQRPSFKLGFIVSTFLLAATVLVAAPVVGAQEQEFGPVVRAYLGYLRNEQEVVDDRVSRREVSAAYYRHNSNRIRALRLMAVRIARETQNDYLPELEAVSREELRLLFEQPPRPESLRVDEVIGYTFRYLGAVRSGETFYLFARLDPYEQSELREKASKPSSSHELQRPAVKMSARTPPGTAP